MDLSGIIFVALAVAWAVYLIPKALKHHDEVARTRSIDRFSTAMRVLARREPVSRRDARLVVTPPRSVDNPRVLAPSTPAPEAAPVAEPVVAAPRPSRPVATRAAARAAARRRRHILSFLLLADAVVATLAGFAVAPWWAVAVPVTLTVLYLVLCRTQVRRDQVAGWDREIAASVEAEQVSARRPAARVEAHDGVRRTAVADDVDDSEDTVALEVALLDAVAVPTEDGGSLWDPLPMTLPTYVTKPKARRTVRTIDLSEPNTWTSGRTEEDARLVAETAAQAAVEAAEAEAEIVATEQARAVGS